MVAIIFSKLNFFCLYLIQRRLETWQFSSIVSRAILKVQYNQVHYFTQWPLHTLRAVVTFYKPHCCSVVSQCVPFNTFGSQVSQKEKQCLHIVCGVLSFQRICLNQICQQQVSKIVIN